MLNTRTHALPLSPSLWVREEGGIEIQAHHLEGFLVLAVDILHRTYGKRACVPENHSRAESVHATAAFVYAQSISHCQEPTHQVQTKGCSLVQKHSKAPRANWPERQRYLPHYCTNCSMNCCAIIRPLALIAIFMPLISLSMSSMN